MGTIHMMAIDRGWKRETTVYRAVDISMEVAGRVHCIECGGTGDWTPFYPEKLPPGSIPCVECKGTGLVWVSI